MDARTVKIDSSGTNEYFRNGAGVTSPVVSDSNANYTPGISEKRGTATRYLHSGLKNADSQTDPTKTVMATRDYDAFGNVITASSTGTWNGPFGNAGGFGYQEDPDHGLKLLGHRYYDSSTGRFLSRDPAEDGRNWYTYCHNKPTRYADPSGLDLPGVKEEAEIAEIAAWEAEGLAAPTATGTSSFAGHAIAARAAAILARFDDATLIWLSKLPPPILTILLKLFEIVEQEADNAAYGPGRVGGTLRHSAVATAARALDGQGGVTVLVEESFKKNGMGAGAGYAEAGSVRADCILFDQISLCLDWKFGMALLSRKRKDILERATGAPTLGVPGGARRRFGGHAGFGGWGNAGF
jgi:RHS repeat-associated protein